METPLPVSVSQLDDDSRGDDRLRTRFPLEAVHSLHIDRIEHGEWARARERGRFDVVDRDGPYLVPEYDGQVAVGYLADPYWTVVARREVRGPLRLSAASSGCHSCLLSVCEIDSLPLE
ncbi:hypothetical protein [Candidatus Halobonum tyrrellensis]|uniref:hypothetical protein n=1 Tax=Candidatus Halobonum tyrrellensis TaxID=1431545 RepID=UPI0012689FA7|nr:hypothetical protein [Candidatus Halobonum tyrrellensis]